MIRRVDRKRRNVRKIFELRFERYEFDYEFLIHRNMEENTGKQLYDYTFNIFRMVQIQSCLRDIKTGTKDNISKYVSLQTIKSL